MCGISRAYKDLGNYVTARSYARRALRTNSAYGLGWIALGEVYEASAESCVEKKKGKVEFNDKLVYELAAIQYRKALKDPEFSQEAERHLGYLQAVLPTKEDKFMHKGQKKPVGPCYAWIK
ncbi:MAG: hypothetical protein D6743_08625 [Calditrichaeota bacterium]|nr:MAG: hypothetical protein D6743_08625 [Calditrichota bacterium]